MATAEMLGRMVLLGRAHASVRVQHVPGISSYKPMAAVAVTAMVQLVTVVAVVVVTNPWVLQTVLLQQAVQEVDH